MLADRARGPLGVLQGGGAEVDPAAAGGQRRSEGLVVADAAGQLDLHVERPDDRGQQVAVGAAAERGVEVDQVHPLGAGVLPGERRRERVAVRRLGAGLALDEADGLTVGDVDGGQQHEAGRAPGGCGGAGHRQAFRFVVRV